MTLALCVFIPYLISSDSRSVKRQYSTLKAQLKSIRNRWRLNGDNDQVVNKQLVL